MTFNSFLDMETSSSDCLRVDLSGKCVDFHEILSILKLHNFLNNYLLLAMTIGIWLSPHPLQFCCDIWWKFKIIHKLTKTNIFSTSATYNGWRSYWSYPKACPSRTSSSYHQEKFDCRHWTRCLDSDSNEVPLQWSQKTEIRRILQVNSHFAHPATIFSNEISMSICRTYDEKKVLTRMVEGGHLHSISSVDEI